MMPIPLSRSGLKLSFPMMLMLLNACLIIGFNMGLTADSPNEVGVNESLRDRMLGETRSLDSFPNESRTFDFGRSEWVEDKIVPPVMKAAIPIIDWSSRFAYAHRHWPTGVFQLISLGITGVATALAIRQFNTIFTDLWRDLRD